MILEKEIELTMQYYELMFPSRKHVLNHLFCTTGTGYSWINGELVDRCGSKIYDTPYDELLKEQFIKYISIYRERYKSRCEEFNLTDEEIQYIIRKERQKNIDNIKDRKMSWYPMRSKDSCNLYNFPNNITDDYLEGIIECCQNILFDFGYTDENFDGNSILDQNKTAKNNVMIAKKALEKALKLKNERTTTKLKEVYTNLVSKYLSEMDMIMNIDSQLYSEIEKAYSNPDRHYHNLSHLLDMVTEAQNLKFNDKDAVLFSIFYHDFVYDTTKKDNEFESSLIAVNHLRTINVPDKMINKCVKNILATKTHTIQEDNDSNLFLDLDMAVLGQSEHKYKQYCNSIRKEYSSYTYNQFMSGRMSFLRQVLKDRIYITDRFYRKYEYWARLNLEIELYGFLNII